MIWATVGLDILAGVLWMLAELRRRLLKRRAGLLGRVDDRGLINRRCWAACSIARSCEQIDSAPVEWRWWTKRRKRFRAVAASLKLLIMPCSESCCCTAVSRELIPGILGLLHHAARQTV